MYLQLIVNWRSILLGSEAIPVVPLVFLKMCTNECYHSMHCTYTLSVKETSASSGAIVRVFQSEESCNVLKSLQFLSIMKSNINQVLCPAKQTKNFPSEK